MDKLALYQKNSVRASVKSGNMGNIDRILCFAIARVLSKIKIHKKEDRIDEKSFLPERFLRTEWVDVFPKQEVIRINV